MPGRRAGDAGTAGGRAARNPAHAAVGPRADDVQDARVAIGMVVGEHPVGIFGIVPGQPVAVRLLGEIRVVVQGLGDGVPCGRDGARAARKENSQASSRPATRRRAGPAPEPASVMEDVCMGGI